MSKINANELAKQFPNYQIIRLLGEPGGQGEVFLIQLEDDSKAALKIYYPANLVFRINREIEAIKQIQSEAMVDLIEAGTITLSSQSCKYLITSYIAGKDLRTFLTEGNRLSNDQAVKVCKRISKAIDELWKKRIVHRDIKPDNILLSDKGDFYLIDLGIAKYLDKTTLTAAGRNPGTLGYMSPEQALGYRNLTLKSDIFALGITVFECVTGNHPFNSDQNLIGCKDPQTLDYSQFQDTFLKDLVRRMIRIRPADRPSSGDVIQKLETTRRS